MAHRQEGSPTIPIKRLILTWGLLLGGAELAASYLPLARSWRPLIIVPGVLMFWLFVLLALGSADPLTRSNHIEPGSRVE